MPIQSKMRYITMTRNYLSPIITQSNKIATLSSLLALYYIVNSPPKRLLELRRCHGELGKEFGIGKESVLKQLAQRWFTCLAISNAKILTYFSNKIYGSNFIKQRSESVRV